MKTTSFSRLEKASLLIRQNRTSLYRCRRYYSFCKSLFISQRFFVGSVYIVACTSRDISQQILMRRFSSLVMWRSHQPRSHPDLNRGLYRERVGVVLSAPIRSYHVLMSILTIGLIVENFLAAKTFLPNNTIVLTIGTIASDRMTSQQSATKRILSCFPIVLIGIDVGQGKQHDLLRCVKIYYDL